jgi:hypothetical protein
VTIQDDEQVLPAVYEHAVNVYEVMFQRAQRRVVDENNVILVYEGRLTKLIEELHLSTPYYTSVMKALKAMGCVRQLRRGGGSTASQWELLRTPSRELYLQNADAVNQGGRRSVVDRIDELENSVAAFSQRQRDLQMQLDSQKDVLEQLASIIRRMSE